MEEKHREPTLLLNYRARVRRRVYGQIRNLMVVNASPSSNLLSKDRLLSLSVAVQTCWVAQHKLGAPGFGS